MFIGIDQKRFDKLLDWLSSNRDEAARQYEHIRSALIKIFLARGCSNAEDLADETFNRVCLKIEVLEKTYKGEKIRYFLGVARNIVQESRRSREIHIGDNKFFEEITKDKYKNNGSESEITLEMECLKKCLDELEENQRRLILEYYDVDRAEKIQRHKSMSEKNSKSDNALRNRVFRIRKKLSESFHNCLNQKKRDIS